MGAALLSGDKIYQGFNIENVSYSLSICAERVAAIRAIYNRDTEFKQLAIASRTPEFPYPCGACLQFLAEFSRDIKIMLINREKEVKHTTLKELFPHPFDKS